MSTVIKVERMLQLSAWDRRQQSRVYNQNAEQKLSFMAATMRVMAETLKVLTDRSRHHGCGQN